MSDLKDPKCIAKKAREIPIEVLIEYSLQASRETIDLLNKFNELVALKKYDSYKRRHDYEKGLNNIKKYHSRLMGQADILKNLLADIEARSWGNTTIN